jgi:hypothetical protein
MDTYEMMSKVARFFSFLLTVAFVVWGLAHIL